MTRFCQESVKKGDNYRNLIGANDPKASPQDQLVKAELHKKSRDHRQGHKIETEFKTARDAKSVGISQSASHLTHLSDNPSVPFPRNAPSLRKFRGRIQVQSTHYFKQNDIGQRSSARIWAQDDRGLRGDLPWATPLMMYFGFLKCDADGVPVPSSVTLLKRLTTLIPNQISAFSLVLLNKAAPQVDQFTSCLVLLAPNCPSRGPTNSTIEADIGTPRTVGFPAVGTTFIENVSCPSSGVASGHALAFPWCPGIIIHRGS
ncbi:hypothetical protein HYDPIDRAFT_189599 [Hydnomerulius pinastri MD-312]|uniref:Uncharacterized protein n=1 Tax=Hydnomerulius pinastri MD-312 TaxID=994086 RepID=A0A0C9WC07_9AGAM|nr:hypothetical protein HYDPIDRAFT_189599 [Hydnomerulius pinastri MD-312]